MDRWRIILCLSRFKDSRSSMLDGDPYEIHKNGTLQIHVSQAVNSGKYTCVARNNLGISENHVYLEVKGQRFSLSVHSSESGLFKVGSRKINLNLNLN